MGALDQIRQMKQEGFSEQEISDSLREQGISPNSITDAFSQARIKDVVEGEAQMQENNFTEAPSPFSAPETYSPQEMPQAQYYSPQEPSYAPSQETESYSPQEGYGESQGGFGTDTIIEIAEQVFEEKIKKLSQQISNFKEFSAIAETKFSNFENRLKKVESIIENLQIKILEKVGSYGDGLESIKKEMTMMQDSFSKTLPMFAKPYVKKPVEKTSTIKKKGK
ncbi:hypothetical protein HYS72_00030 [Candidatus Pacearchaeota archaeon]|nr:hypothetical protein [Candidatus Pacearchaeota archaeon]MBI2056769.1 hypothetical protein [Candidatus Pacearchaeota archaeon]